jgi:hypothetical protein
MGQVGCSSKGQSNGGRKLSENAQGFTCLNCTYGKPMEFPDASGKRINMMYPTDQQYWDKLKDFVDYEPVSEIDSELRSVLASIGIVKGEPFKPDRRQC